MFIDALQTDFFLEDVGLVFKNQRDGRVLTSRWKFCLKNN